MDFKFKRKKTEAEVKNTNAEEIERLEKIRNAMDPTDPKYKVIQENIESLRKDARNCDHPKKEKMKLSPDAVLNCGVAVLQTCLVIFCEDVKHISHKGFSTIKKPR